MIKLTNDLSKALTSEVSTHSYLKTRREKGIMLKTISKPLAHFKTVQTVLKPLGPFQSCPDKFKTEQENASVVPGWPALRLCGPARCLDKSVLCMDEYVCLINVHTHG